MAACVPGSAASYASCILFSFFIPSNSYIDMFKNSHMRTKYSAGGFVPLFSHVAITDVFTCSNLAKSAFFRLFSLISVNIFSFIVILLPSFIFAFANILIDFTRICDYNVPVIK